MSRPGDSGGGSAGASPAEDIDAGCRALARCAESAGWRRSLTLAAWREGEKAVQGWIDACPQFSESALVDAFATEETRRFTREVLDRWAELEPPPESSQARR